MTTQTIKKQDIKYWSLDYNDLYERFKDFAKSHYPDIYRDFSQPSAGVMLAQFMCYVGDVNDMRIDHNYDEQFLDLATEPKTLFKKANSEGYKIPGRAPASGYANWYMTVPATISGSVFVPDLDYALTLRRGTRAFGTNGQSYELIEDVKFSDIDVRDRAKVVIKARSAAGVPTHFALKKTGKIIAGVTKTHSVTLGSYEKYRVVTLPDVNVSQIISCTDTEGNTHYEVDYLAQDSVYVHDTNTASDLTLVPNVLRTKMAPYRFVVKRNPNTRKWEMHFGAGSSDDTNNDIVPNVGDLALPLYGKDSFSDPHIDPQNFLRSKTLGMSPTNTTLTIKYRTGGGIETNAASNAIDTVGEKKYQELVSGLDANVISEVLNSISVLNSDPIVGGSDGLYIDQLKLMIKAFKAAQMRCVSIEDYTYKAYSMPAEFGSVFRAYAKRNPVNKNAVLLYVLAKNQYGHLQSASSTLKTNLQTFFKNTTQDSVDIMDTDILNVGINFTVVSDGTRNAHEILVECVQKLKNHFNIDQWQIGQPIVISKLSDLLDDVNGVYSVASIEVVGKAGIIENRSYGSKIFGIPQNTKNGIIYALGNSIFEVKYIDHDIRGRVL